MGESLSDSPRTKSREPFADPGLGALRIGIAAARSHPKIWLGALGYLVVFEVAIEFMRDWLDLGAGSGMIRVALLAGVIGYVVPTVWALEVGRSVGKEEMKTFLEARIHRLTYLGLAIGVAVTLIALGFGVGLFFFIDAWVEGNWFLPVAIGLLAGVVLLRLGVALLIVVPASLVEDHRVADAMKRAWRLSRRKPGVLIPIVLVGGLVQLGGGIATAAVFGSDWISDRTFDLVIAPLSSSVLNLWWILTSGAAYGIARKRADGYPLTDVQRDLEQLLRPSQTDD